MTKYDGLILIVFVTSSWLILFWIYAAIKEWITKRKERFIIINAEYGTGRHFNDVTHIIKDLIKKSMIDHSSIKVDDENFLERNKIDDPVPGSKKRLRLSYWHRFDIEIEQGEGRELKIPPV